MKRLFSYIVIIAALLTGPARAFAQEILDEGTRTVLGEKLDGYMKAIERESAQIKCRETDFLIESASDSLVRQFIAIHLYSSYLNSKVMGDEAVAVHLIDEWFASGKVSFRDELDLINAKVYADFTRSSLVGKKAPELFPDTFGNRPVILYFYDTNCSKCKLESNVISRLLEKKDYPVDLVAFYTGDNQNAWTEYIKERLSPKCSDTEIRHQWDPDHTTGFQKKYGVLSTPHLLLVDSDRTIIGRDLDSYALAVLLEELFNHNDIVYGDRSSMEFFEMMFDDKASEKDIIAVADMIYSKSSEGQRGLKAAKQALGDLLLYIGPKNKEEFRKGTGYLIDRYIKDNPIWNCQNDSLQIIGYSDFLSGIINRPEYGAKLPKARVEMTIINGNKEKTGVRRLDKAARNAVVIFHSEGCPICQEEISAGRKSGQKIIEIDMDRIIESYPESADMLFEALDLTALPFIFRTDSKGRLINKYISLIKD